MYLCIFEFFQNLEWGPLQQPRSQNKKPWTRVVLLNCTVASGIRGFSSSRLRAWGFTVSSLFGTRFRATGLRV